MRYPLIPRAAGILVLFCLVAGALPPWLVTGRSRPGRTDAGHRRLEQFLAMVAARTRPGDRVAVLVPPEMREAGTISYRIAYLLPRRDSLRVYFEQSEADLSVIRKGDWLAVFGDHPGVPASFQPLIKTHDGALYRRVTP